MDITQESLKELFYVAALLQGSTRRNVTISSLDLEFLLRSRYNLELEDHSRILTRVLGNGTDCFRRNMKEEGADDNRPGEDSSHAAVSNEVIVDDDQQDDEPPPHPGNLTETLEMGDDHDFAEESLDMVQLFSILLIPTLLQMKVEFTHNDDASIEPNHDSREQWLEQWQTEQPVSILQSVLAVMLKSLPERYDAWPPKLDESLVKDLLQAHGEDCTDDGLIREMVQAASCGTSGCLDEMALLSALTDDVASFALPTSVSQHVVCMDIRKKGEEDHKEDTVENEDEEDPPTKSNNRNGRIWNNHDSVLAHLATDFTVDSHTSVVLVICLWIFAVFVSLTYGPYVVDAVTAPCLVRGDGDLFGCRLSSTLTTW